MFGQEKKMKEFFYDKLLFLSGLIIRSYNIPTLTHILINFFIAKEPN